MTAAAFPSAEDAVLVLLDDLGAAGTYLPADLHARLPFHLVYRFAGRDDGLTDFPVVGVDTFAPTRVQGQDLAERARQRLTAAPHQVTVDGLVVVLDDVRTAEGPHEVPYGDARTRRWVASYTVELRRPVRRS